MTPVGEYTLSSFAQRDLVEAAVYAAKRAGSPEVGDRLIERLAVVMQKLAEFPTLGRARPELRPRLRSFPRNPFVIFYRRTRTGVHILRILHQREDLQKAFPSQPRR